MLIYRSIKNLLRCKSRSFLTMAGIAVGVFALVLISAVGAAGTAKVGDTLLTMGVDTLLVQSAQNTASATLTDADAAELRRVSGVSDVMPLMASLTETRILDRRLNCYLWGVDKSADKLVSLTAKYGRLINNADAAARSRVCVIDEAFALETYGRGDITGKKINIFLGGKYHEFEVVGIAHSGLSSLQNMLESIMPDFIYIPTTTMQSLCGRTTYDKLAVKLSDPNGSEQTVDLITERLDALHSTKDGYICNNLLSQKAQLDDIMSVVTTALSLVAAISLVVSGISVMTTMMMSVGERTREIGIKKAIGAGKQDICAEFLSESVMMSLLGSAAGAVLGLLTAFIGCLAAGVDFPVNIGSLLVSIGAAAAIGAVFGAYPAIKAAGIRPAEAVRYS